MTHIFAATEPLYILMEFAMHGSLKDYLKSVKSGELPNPQLLLYQQQQLQMGQASPIAIPPTTVATNQLVTNGSALCEGVSLSSAYPVTNQKSTLSLCPYHYNQLTQHNHTGATPYNNMSSSAPTTGGAPGDQHYHHLYPPAGAQAAEESASLYNVDPTSKAHAMRLLRLLNSDYGLQRLADDLECCHGDTQDGAAIKLGQSAYSYSYSGLSEMCVRRACLDDYPYWYHGTVPRNDYYNSYYNYSKQQEAKEDSESPFAETPGTNAPLLPPAHHSPPIYVNVCEGEGEANSPGDLQQQQQEYLCHHLSAPNLNPYHSYNLSTMSGGCVYCCQCAAVSEGGERGGRVGVYQETGADQTNPGGGGAGMNVNTDNTETRLSYFEVLDFALQIARGMEHLEKMKVCYSLDPLKIWEWPGDKVMLTLHAACMNYLLG